MRDFLRIRFQAAAALSSSCLLTSFVHRHHSRSSSPTYNDATGRTTCLSWWAGFGVAGVREGVGPAGAATQASNSIILLLDRHDHHATPRTPHNHTAHINPMLTPLFSTHTPSKAQQPWVGAGGSTTLRTSGRRRAGGLPAPRIGRPTPWWSWAASAWPPSPPSPCPRLWR